jgi:hypothetical protein
MQTQFLSALVIIAAVSARGEIVSKPVAYKQGDVVLEGLSVYDGRVMGFQQ